MAPDAPLLVPGECSIHVSLHEHELVGHSFESWPPAVQNIVERELTAWRHRNPDREIVGLEPSVSVRVCVVKFTHREILPSEAAP